MAISPSGPSRVRPIILDDGDAPRKIWIGEQVTPRPGDIRATLPRKILRGDDTECCPECPEPAPPCYAIFSRCSCNDCGSECFHVQGIERPDGTCSVFPPGEEPSIGDVFRAGGLCCYQFDGIFDNDQGCPVGALPAPFDGTCQECCDDTEEQCYAKILPCHGCPDQPPFDLFTSCDNIPNQEIIFKELGYCWRLTPNPPRVFGPPPGDIIGAPTPEYARCRDCCPPEEPPESVCRNCQDFEECQFTVVIDIPTLDFSDCPTPCSVGGSTVDTGVVCGGSVEELYECEVPEDTLVRVSINCGLNNACGEEDVYAWQGVITVFLPNGFVIAHYRKAGYDDPCPFGTYGFCRIRQGGGECVDPVLEGAQIVVSRGQPA